MKPQQLTHKALVFALISCLVAPQPAFALRPLNARNSPTVEQSLAAGLEETAFERRISERLDSLRFETQQRLKTGVQQSRISGGYLKQKLVAIADAFLDHPHPSEAEPHVRDLMQKINSQVLAPLRQAEAGQLSPEMLEVRELAVILPVADDWLVFAYSQVRQEPGAFERRTRALAAYSRRAAALAWGRTGPHLRADFVPFDKDDIRLAPILLRAFLPQAQELWAKIQRKERLSERGKRRAEEYAGLLLNGLMVPGENLAWEPLKDYREFFGFWAAESNGRLRPAIGLAVLAFPKKFPLEPARMPDFLRFANQQFAFQEIKPLRDYNRANPSWPLTLWELTAGTGWTDRYIRYLESSNEKLLERNLLLMEKVYALLLQESGAVDKAGAEEFSITGLSARTVRDQLAEYGAERFEFDAGSMAEHLVRGEGGSWWVHFHARTASRNGFLAELRLKERKLAGLGRIYVEADATLLTFTLSTTAFVPLPMAVSSAQVPEITANAWAFIRQHAKPLEREIAADPTDVEWLARSVTFDEPELVDIFPEHVFDAQGLVRVVVSAGDPENELNMKEIVYRRVLPAGAEEAEVIGIPLLRRDLSVPKGVFDPGHPSTDAFLRLVLEHPEYFKDKDVLEWGSGSGALTIALARAGARVTAVDVSPLAVETTLKNLEQEPEEVRARVKVGQSYLYDNVASVTGQISPAFDVVISNNPVRNQKPSSAAEDVLSAGHEYRVVRQALQNLSEVLRPGGTAFVMALDRQKNGPDDFWLTRDHLDRFKPEQWRMKTTAFSFQGQVSLSKVSIFAIQAPGYGEHVPVGRYHWLSPSEFFRKTWRPGMNLKTYFSRYFRLWNRRVVEGEQEGGLFMVLFRQPSDKQLAEEGPHHKQVRHVPFLEQTIFEAAKLLGVNAADVVIPTYQERSALARLYSKDRQISPEDISLRRVVSSYTPEEARQFQQDRKKAFTRALLVLGILARVWDLHPGNADNLPGTLTPVFFDFEEGLNSYYADMELYTSAFLLNYFQPRFHKGPIRFRHLSDLIDWAEWSAAIRDVEAADFEQLREQVKAKIGENSYDGELPPRVARRIDGYFDQLAGYQRSIRKDAKQFWTHASSKMSRHKDAAEEVSDKADTSREKPSPAQQLAAAAEYELSSTQDPGTYRSSKRAVIIEAGTLFWPQTAPLIEALDESVYFKGRTYFWGEDSAPKPDEVRFPEGLRHIKTQEELEYLFLRLAEEGLEVITYVGQSKRDVEEALDAVMNRTGMTIELERAKQPGLAGVLEGLGIPDEALSKFRKDSVFAPALALSPPKSEDAAGAEEMSVLPYGADWDITNILRGLDREDAQFGGQVSRALLQALSRAREEGRKARILIVGAGAGAIVYDVKELLDHSPNAEVLYINKERIELDRSADRAAWLFAEEVVLKRKPEKRPGDFERAMEEARLFLRAFRNEVAIRDANRGFRRDERFKDGSFDVVLMPAAFFPYAWRKAYLLHETERILREGGVAFINDFSGISTQNFALAQFLNLLSGNRYEYGYHHLRIDKRKPGTVFPVMPGTYSRQKTVVKVDQFDSRYPVPAFIRKRQDSLDKSAARIAAVAESARQEGDKKAVVVDLSAIVGSPELDAVLASLDRLASRAVVVGFAPLVDELERKNSRLRFARDDSRLENLLDIMRVKQGIEGVVFIGSADRAFAVGARVRSIGLSFMPAAGTPLAALLAGLGVPAGLAAELAAGIEEAALLGTGA